MSVELVAPITIVAVALAALLPAHGVRIDDLGRHTGEWGEPISTTYRGYTVYETPPPTQGVTALLALNMAAQDTWGAHRNPR